MALYGVQFTATYMAVNTASGLGRAGDSANHTLRWVKDGTVSTLNTSPSECDAANCPGAYKIVVNATLAQCIAGTLAGKSSTGNTAIIPVQIPFERLPNAAPGADGGLPTRANLNTATAALLTVNTATAALNTRLNTTWSGKLDAAITTRATNALLQTVNTYASGLNTRLNTTVAGRLDRAVSTRAPSNTALSNATWTDARAGLINTINAYAAGINTRTNTTRMAYIDVAISSRSSHNTAQVWTYTNRVLTGAANVTSDGNAVNATQIARLDADVSSRSSHNAADVNTTLSGAHGSGNWSATADVSLLTTLNTRLNSTWSARLDATVSSRATNTLLQTVNTNVGTLLTRVPATVDGVDRATFDKVLLAFAAGNTSVNTTSARIIWYARDGSTEVFRKRYTGTTNTDARPRAVNSSTIA